MGHVPVMEPLDFIHMKPPLWVIPYDKSLFGEVKTPDAQLMLREEGKLLSQSLLQELHGIHLKGYCLHKPLSLDQLVVTSLGRLEIKEGTLIMQSQDPLHIHADWYWASCILRGLLKTSVDLWMTRNSTLRHKSLELPRDVRHLFQLLEHPALPKGYLAAFHPSCLPLHARSGLYGCSRSGGQLDDRRDEAEYSE